MATPKRGLLGEYAGFVSRGAALILDIVLISTSVIFLNWLVALPISFFTSVDVAPCVANPAAYTTILGITCRLLGLTWLAITLLTSPLYFTILFATTGQTVGMYVLGLRVVRTDGAPMTVWRGFLRWLGYFVSALPFGLGFFWIFVNDQRRGFHDLITDTSVVYAWHARYNEFFMARVRRWLYRGGESKRTVQLDGHYSLVTAAVPDRTRMRTLLDIMEKSVIEDNIDVLYTAVYVTDHAGVPQLFGVTDLDATTDDLHLYDVQYEIPAEQLAKIRAEMEPESFIVCVLLQDQYADTLVALISKRLPAQIRSYDMGTKAQMQSRSMVRSADAGLVAFGAATVAAAIDVVTTPPVSSTSSDRIPSRPASTDVSSTHNPME